MAGDGGEEGDGVEGDAFFAGDACAEAEAAVVEGYDMDWAGWGGEAEEVLVVCWSDGGGEVSGIAVECYH